MKKKKVSDKVIKNVITGLFDSFEKESRVKTLKQNKVLISRIGKVIKGDNITDIYYKVNHPLTESFELAIIKEIPTKDSTQLSKLAFFLQNISHIQYTFERFIVEREGTCCSVDKSSFLIRSLYSYLKGDIKEFDMKINKKCFWKPNFWNRRKGKEWIELFDALQRFHWGKDKPYFEFLKKYYLPWRAKQVKK